MTTALKLTGLKFTRRWKASSYCSGFHSQGNVLSTRHCRKQNSNSIYVSTHLTTVNKSQY